MRSTADVLIIGGGLMGCATAYTLAQSGVRVILAERNAKPGLETTARSGAIIRAHYGVPELVTLALEANKRYQTFEDEVGLPCDFVPCGYAVMVDEADIPTLKANVEMHQSMGVNVSLIAPSVMAERVPSLKTQDIALVAWEPDGGYANPSMTVNAYATRAAQLGVSLCFDASVIAASPESNGWKVTLSNGDVVSAAQVVLCTGNWSRPVGALFGLELPVTPTRAQIVVLNQPFMSKENAELFPVLSDLVNLAYFRSDGADGMWVGSSDMSDLQETLPKPEGFNEMADPSAIDSAKRKAAMRFNGLNTMDKGSVQRAFCGLYETTPDWQPIIDSFGDTLHAAVGFSGHGFKLAPVIGEIMAGRVTNITSTWNTSLFALSRFAENRPIKSRHVYQRARFLR